MHRLFAVALLLACDVAHEPLPSSRHALEAVQGFGSNPGQLLMYRFVPQGLAAGRPLVVLLHGCGDTAENFARSSGFEALATQRQFALLTPQQQASNNSQTCFNWFDASNQRRGAGEIASVTQMIDRMVADVGSDPARVFVAGFSAGGATAANVLATHPERFRAGVIAAGIPFKCTENLFGATGCMSGVDTSREVHAMRVRSAAGGFTGPWPRVAIWHGLADSLVHPSNRVELRQQWAGVHEADEGTGTTSAIASGGSRTTYRATNGDAVVELNEVTGLDHLWRAAWAADMADFFDRSGSASLDGGTAGGGSAGGGSAGGGSAGGGSAGGGSAGGGSAGGGSAGGSSAAAGGSAPSAGGNTGGGATGATGCSSAPSLNLLLLLAWLTRRR